VVHGPDCVIGVSCNPPPFRAVEQVARLIRSATHTVSPSSRSPKEPAGEGSDWRPSWPGGRRGSYPTRAGVCFRCSASFSAPRFGRRFTRERRGLSGRKLPLPVSTGKRRHATCATLPTLVSQLHLLMLNALKELSEFWPWCQAHGSIRIQEGQPASTSRLHCRW
jgi:hypothetical protein